jgi:hypothetical protein
VLLIAISIVLMLVVERTLGLRRALRG